MKSLRPFNLLRLAGLAAALMAVASCALLRPSLPETEPPDGPPEDPPAAVKPEAPPEDPPEPQPAPQPAPREPTPVPEETRWEVLASGQQSAVRVPVARAIADPELWADVWAALHANRHPQPDRPEVDFERETVVVLLLGERRTGGYSVRITSVIPRGDVVEVKVEVESPGPDDMVTQALTAPYLIATIPYAEVDVAFSGDDLERGFEGD